jgi:hypothetical protein
MGEFPMRDDLLDAQAAVDWAVTQIPLFQSAFLEWRKGDPYELIKEPDPNGSGYAVIAHLRFPLPLTFNAWAGAIIGSLRGALDFVAAALAQRNGHNPSADTHFPVFQTEMDMIDPLTGIEGKKWLSKRERATVKTLKPYAGGDNTIWPLHKLDILRKHQRLIAVQPDLHGFCWASLDPKRPQLIWGGGIGMERLKNKAILYRSKAGEGFDPAKGQTTLSPFIAFNEGRRLLPFVNQEVPAVLMQFAERVSAIIGLFRPYGDLRDLLPLHVESLRHTAYRRPLGAKPSGPP